MNPRVAYSVKYVMTCVLLEVLTIYWYLIADFKCTTYTDAHTCTYAYIHILHYIALHYIYNM